MPAVVAAVQITSPNHHDATQMRETFYSLAAAKANNGGQIDAQTREEVNRILNLVQDTLMGALWEDRDAAQRSYNATVDAVNSCNSHVVEDELPKYEFKKRLTAQDDAALKSCLELENESCENRTRVCNHLDDYVSSWTMCDDHPLNTDQCVECKQETPTDSDLYKALQCLIQFDADHYDNFYHKYDDCHDHKRMWRAKIIECDAVQTDLEHTKCNEQTFIHDTCSTFNQCFSDNTRAYEQQKSNAETLELIFQKQYTALECLVCYGEQILADATNLAICEDAAPPVFECSPGESREVGSKVSLSICYYDPEARYPCEDEFDHCVPGTSSWFTKSYSEWEGTCAAVDECFHTCTEYGE